jgi:hypothetical protein
MACVWFGRVALLERIGEPGNAELDRGDRRSRGKAGRRDDQ